MKTCPFCSEEILDSAILCKHCKSKLDNNVSDQSSPSQGFNPQNTLNVNLNQETSILPSSNTSGLAVATFVISILGVMTCWFMPVIVQLVSIICGHISLRQISAEGGMKGGRGWAISGLVISYLVLAGYLTIALLGLLLGVGLFHAAGH